jgi:hypothetical protein
VVISYYEHEMLNELYRGWTFVSCPVTKSLVNQGARMRDCEPTIAPEILIINGESYTDSNTHTTPLFQGAANS